MKRRTPYVAALVLALTSCGPGGGAAPPTVNTGTLPDLPTISQVQSTNGVASVSLTAKFDANGRPAFYYNGAEGAPTLRVQPGDTIKLHFDNQLPVYCAVGVMSNANLHFHGLSSAPVQPGDEVISTNAPPGASLDYVVQINPDQPPGLYWYHPHPHGISSWMVGNGMVGALVVEGVASEVPATQGLRERVIVLGNLPHDPSVAESESSARRRAMRNGRSTLSARQTLGVPQSCQPDTDAAVTINGLPMARIGIKPGEKELFRVLNGSNHRYFDLAVDGQSLNLISQDGVPLHDFPGGPQSTAVSHVFIPPSGRAEFIVTGGTAPTSLISRCVDTGPLGDAAPQVILALLQDDSTWTSAKSAAPQTRVAAPLALRRSQFYRVALPAASAERTIHFTEDDNGFYLNGAQYDPTGGPSIVAQSGTVEEWTLENDSDEAHTFHIHQAHFTVESAAADVAPTAAHWVDTAFLPAQSYDAQGNAVPSVTKVLIDFRDPTIRGTFVYHCHVLDHEDGGMMAKLLLQ